MLCPLRLKKGVEVEIRKGYPWIFARDIIASSELELLPAGSLVAIETHKGELLGTGYYNAQSPICCRVLAPGKTNIDVDFFKQRLQRALMLRETIGVPFYRLAHSEGDFLPGLLLDRFGDIVVAQVGTAGMEALQPLWLEALEAVVAPKAIVFRNDSGARLSEGLAQEVRIVKGEVPSLVEVKENGCIYLADLLKGQKTGWFFDQRDNRKMIADRAQGKILLDVYSHSGGFGLLAAKHGAAHVTLLDSSALALDLAKKAAAKNGVECSYLQGDAFDAMQKLHKGEKQFDIVLADPPAFVKSRKDIVAGMKGYEKVARLAAALVKPGGLLFVASCSHHAGREAFNQAVLSGVRAAGFEPAILAQTGAASDHPPHPLLPQNEYLKGILLALS